MIELIFAIVVIAVTVLSLPMMTDVTSSGSSDTIKAEEAIFEAYVKALEVTDGNYSSLAEENGSVLVTGGGTAQGFKFSNFKADVTITQGSGFGAFDVGDGNISFITVSVKDGSDVVSKLYTYDFNIQR